MSSTMTTRSKRRGFQLTSSTIDPQNNPQPGSTGNDLPIPVGPATELPHEDISTDQAGLEQVETTGDTTLEPIPEEDKVEDKFAVAEFESNRSMSPEIDEGKLTTSDGGVHSPSIKSIDQPEDKVDGAILEDDQFAYELAHDINGPWESPSKDEESAQQFLDELSDHQRAVMHVLAHRQVGQMFRRLGFEEIDPDSNLYHEQYNLTVTTMVGGGMIMGRDNQGDEPDRDSPVENTLCRVVNRISENSKTGMVKPFEFAWDDRMVRQANSPVRIKEEEITLRLSSPTGSRGSPMGPPVPDPIMTQMVPPPPAPKVDKGKQRTISPEQVQARVPQLTPWSQAKQYGKTLKDKVILQRWRECDIADTGRTDIVDQGIYIDENSDAFII
ncbi:hypothetical protein ARMGADRAFT_1090924 [Armillaria gallica]|uniref:Uncharacterized protein n=1 Tax=Armillaria gallica TaxID=47427 RepID=A0A2H3CYK2_ARMGA|nr:hypothetical protein ARMGADRAFT_1090924 [Armillaria gallica]